MNDQSRTPNEKLDYLKAHIQELEDENEKLLQAMQDNKLKIKELKPKVKALERLIKKAEEL